MRMRATHDCAPIICLFFKGAPLLSILLATDLLYIEHTHLFLPSLPFQTVQDFVSSVMDVDYSPTGREFVAGSYDRSVRIFCFNAGHSREVYHTKRMQRVFAVQYGMDGSYVYSGSDDMNVRVSKLWGSVLLSVHAEEDWVAHYVTLPMYTCIYVPVLPGAVSTPLHCRYGSRRRPSSWAPSCPDRSTSRPTARPW